MGAAPGPACMHSPLQHGAECHAVTGVLRRPSVLRPLSAATGVAPPLSLSSGAQMAPGPRALPRLEHGCAGMCAP